MKFTSARFTTRPTWVFIGNDPQRAAGGYVDLAGHLDHRDVAVQTVLQERHAPVGAAELPGVLSRELEGLQADRQG